MAFAWRVFLCSLEVDLMGNLQKNIREESKGCRPRPSGRCSSRPCFPRWSAPSGWCLGSPRSPGFMLNSEDAPQNDHKIRNVYKEPTTIQTCLKPLAERAMANLRPSLVKTGASSSSNHPPGEVMIKLSWQSPLGRKIKWIEVWLEWESISSLVEGMFHLRASQTDTTL